MQIRTYRTFVQNAPQVSGEDINEMNDEILTKAVNSAVTPAITNPNLNGNVQVVLPDALDVSLPDPNGFCNNFSHRIFRKYHLKSNER